MIFGHPTTNFHIHRFVALNSDIGHQYQGEMPIAKDNFSMA